MTTSSDSVRELRRRWAWEELAWWERKAEDTAPGWRKEVVLRRDHPTPYVEHLARCTRDTLPLLAYLRGIGWVPLYPRVHHLRSAAVIVTPFPCVTVVSPDDNPYAMARGARTPERHVTYAPPWVALFTRPGVTEGLPALVHTVPPHIRAELPAVVEVGGWGAGYALLAVHAPLAV